MLGLLRFSLYALCAPWDGAVLVLSILLLGTQLGGVRKASGSVWLDVRRGSLLHRRWRYSTTLGHVILLQPGVSREVERHELVHVRQYEGAVCSVWVAALVFASLHAVLGHAYALVALLLGAPWWSYAGAALAAALRGTRPYLDNHFERHARAETRVTSDRASEI